ncbi:MAG: hypothetical protein NVV72_10435 [Asticcacaulis sp.]|nr:hypothetical protein [Asticcacaulis sp.]
MIYVLIVEINMAFHWKDFLRLLANIKFWRRSSVAFTELHTLPKKIGPLKNKFVLKLIPVKMYEIFGKSFESECTSHSEVAENAEHVVRIIDMFDASVDFEGLLVLCHVAVLEYIEGKMLGDYIRGSVPLSAAAAAQISADLFRIKGELEQHLSNHNDLHADNIMIEQLSRGRYRQGAMDPTIRAVAIDLGSLGGDRRSDDTHFGDLHWIGVHIQKMVERLLSNLDSITDLDARISHALQLIASAISPKAEHQRTPAAADFIKLIEAEYFKTSEPWRPWREQLKLRTFGASYNAQTLDAWHVPQLLVDPDGAWLARISAPGPLIVTGMRGCGKTLLLRAMQFHARAARQSDEQDAAVLTRVKRDNYVGLFVSAQRLLSIETAGDPEHKNSFARLFVAYGLEAARALAHLSDLDSSYVPDGGYIAIADAIVENLSPRPEVPEILTIEQLERYLIKLVILVGRSDDTTELASHPGNAFPQLADAIRKSSALWSDAQILFLLDDVSTRYIAADRIEVLLSALIFQNPLCAFKITSEAQTIFLSLKSPGQVNPAAAARDFETFDLGADVHGRLRDHHVGKRFVEDILNMRAKFYASHPKAKPSQILGDLSYEDIARTIALTSKASGDRKTVYHGITALTGMCVGDIGSVISLYEDMLNRAEGKFPISAKVQSDAFQDFCSRHLYLLDRRGSHLKDFAKAFAEAAHELLVQSARKKTASKPRLRQYASIYVRVTTGDFSEQMKILRELVDAGVFVFTGGAPRTKTRDSNPTQQFKLTYRKIYGLVNFIGLAERDRFELSGADLEEWLRAPTTGKAILMRNLNNDPDDDMGEEPGDIGTDLTAKSGKRQASEQPFLEFFEISNEKIMDATPADRVSLSGAHLPLPTISSQSLDDTAGQKIETLVIGLGFEDRAFASVDRILATSKPNRILAISYKVEGKTKEIVDLIKKRKVPLDIITYENAIKHEFPRLGENVYVDITALAKPALFGFVRSSLRESRKICIIYTEADRYYPLDDELVPILEAEEKANHHELLQSLKNVLMGEVGPYKLMPLLKTESDGTRMRSLCAFASSKHERLLHLAEVGDYDQMDILVDNGVSPRTRIAQLVAEVAARENPNATVSKYPFNDLSGHLEALTRRYENWFLRDGLNFEVGLTGNKIQAVAAATLSAAFHLNQVWYVAPEQFDSQRFTTGAGVTHCFTIELAQSGQ